MNASAQPGPHSTEDVMSFFDPRRPPFATSDVIALFVPACTPPQPAPQPPTGPS